MRDNHSPVSLSGLSDDEVLVKAVAGDKEAFGVLYERYVGRIYTYIYYRTGNTHDAEDLTARVFYRAIEHIKRYRQRGVPFSAWLYRIAHNLVANWHRDRQRRQEVPIDDVINLQAKIDPPELTMMNTMDVERLMKVIQSLSPERQELIILKFVQELSNAEIGRIMRRSEGAIKSLYHRTLLSLRDDLDFLVYEIDGSHPDENA
ncbi:MAG: sigma-70 family RNA polymerase sigma factor [Anaerolineaceae bacterium]|nr:sigma-70 family RNA polymerase sigma factor [Anaerolineaceae bacterium]MBN2676499.1 sigma-70 family RNA polymerase sigma factor [Anaerolineaceae bacterium]